MNVDDAIRVSERMVGKTPSIGRVIARRYDKNNVFYASFCAFI